MMDIPKFLEHLPRHGEYPVPFVMMWIDGKPDFRTVDREKIIECYVKKLCGICGHRLGEFSYFIGGDASKENHAFLDPPMHEACAEFASTICPFLIGERGYSERKPPQIEGGIVSSRPPEISEGEWILKARTKQTRMAREPSTGVAFVAGRWLKCVRIRTGRGTGSA